LVDSRHGCFRVEVGIRCRLDHLITFPFFWWLIPSLRSLKQLITVICIWWRRTNPNPNILSLKWTEWDFDVPLEISGTKQNRAEWTGFWPERET
jgi:hypothetical protein